MLGPLTVEHDGQPVIIGGQRLRALFIRLAVEPGRWVSASSLVDALWDGDAPADPLNALQSLVSRLRRLLPSPELIVSAPARYRLAVEAHAVDIAQFEMSASAGRQALASGDAVATAFALRKRTSCGGGRRWPTSTANSSQQRGWPPASWPTAS
jgi:DNA-binding SARP family transcriptional activator